MLLRFHSVHEIKWLCHPFGLRCAFVVVVGVYSVVLVFFEYFVLLPSSMCRLHFVNMFMVANHRRTTSAAMASAIGPKVESEEAIFNIRIHNTRCRIECCKWESGTAPAYKEINRSQELFSDVVLSKNVVVVVVTIVAASSSSSSLHHISWNFFFFCSATFFLFFSSLSTRCSARVHNILF